MMFSRKVMIGLLALGCTIVISYFAGIGTYFSLEHLKEHQKTFAAFVSNNYISSVILYIALYAVLIACALPIIAPMTLIGGYLYGYVAIAYAAVACLIGSVISFLVIRYVLAHWLRGWHNEKVDNFNLKIQKYGSSYLLMLQFLSIIPLFVINLLAAVTHVPFKTVCWTTLVGCMPIIILFVIAGRQLSNIQSIGEIFSPTVIIIFILLAIFAVSPIFLRRFKKTFGI